MTTRIEVKKGDLITFEEEVALRYDAGEIQTPVHLSGGNEGSHPTMKPWMRPTYLAWRKKLEKTPEFRKKVNARIKKRLTNDPSFRAKYDGYVKKYKKKHKLRILAKRAIRRAELSGIDIDKEFLRWLGEQTIEKCEACGSDFDYDGAAKNHQAHPRVTTLDRIDQQKGYVRDNIGVICWRCNRIKSDATISELRTLVEYMERKCLPKKI